MWWKQWVKSQHYQSQLDAISVLFISGFLLLLCWAIWSKQFWLRHNIGFIPEDMKWVVNPTGFICGFVLI